MNPTGFECPHVGQDLQRPVGQCRGHLRQVNPSACRWTRSGFSPGLSRSLAGINSDNLIRFPRDFFVDKALLLSWTIGVSTVGRHFRRPGSNPGATLSLRSGAGHAAASWMSQRPLQVRSGVAVSPTPLPTTTPTPHPILVWPFRPFGTLTLDRVPP